MRLALAIFLFPLLGTHAVAEPETTSLILEVPTSVRDVFVADTSAATLYHFRQGQNGLKLASEYYMSIGSNGAGKRRAWDRKTPLGIYFVTGQLDTSRMHEKYGYTAFPLDYPNVWDQQNGRTGDGVWVHGVANDSEQRPPLDTDGCIALPNDVLRAIEHSFVPQLTPVIVMPAIQGVPHVDAQATTRQGLRSAIDAWADQLAKRDLSAYLSMYSADFRYRGLNRDEWTALRKRLFVAAAPASLSIDQLLLLVDPSAPGVYLSRFFLVSEREGHTSKILKRLYWRRADSGKWEIVAEDNG